MTKIKAVIFDMDGVLIDAKEWHYEALNQALRLYGYEISRKDHLERFDGLSTNQKLKILSDEKGLPPELHKKINEQKQAFTHEIIEQKCKPLKYHQEALSRLRAQGYKLAMCSNSIRATIDTMLKKAEIDQYLDFWLSNQDVVSPKPNPEIYIKAINRLGLRPKECLIVEDNPHGVQAATLSGAHVLKVEVVHNVTYYRIKERITEIEQIQNKEDKKTVLNIIVPMAGAGRRFMEMGYEKPKPFIDVLGKPMICHVLDNLNIEGAKFTLLTRKEHFEAEQETVDFITQNYNVEWVLIDKLTEGAACTVLHAHRQINNDNPLLIANSDQVVDMDIKDYLKDCDERNLDGSILCFEDNDSKWSYAKVDENGLVTSVKEKVVISKYATVGIYYFMHGKTFVEGALDMIVRNERVNNEFYVAPAYNWAIKQGGRFGIFNIDKTQMHGTGTPEDLDKYIEFKKGPVRL